MSIGARFPGATQFASLARGTAAQAKRTFGGHIYCAVHDGSVVWAVVRLVAAVHDELAI